MSAGSPKSPLPRWDLTPVYASFASPEYLKAKDRLEKSIRSIERHIKDYPAKNRKTAGTWLKRYIELYNGTADLFENLFSYAYMLFSADTRNAEAAREISSLEGIGVPLKTAEVNFRNLLAGMKAELDETMKKVPELREYRFFLKEQRLLQKRQMAPELEELAAELSRSGGDSWERLHQSLSSTLMSPWEGGAAKTVTELRALAFDPNRAVRKLAYEKELAAWKSVEIPLAFALNGVKGFSVTLNGRRGYRDTLERSILQSRITPLALDSLSGVLEDALPLFRRYLELKAKALKVPKLAFFDLFAPLGRAGGSWSYERAAAFITEKFSRFSKDLGAFAARAFSEGWIDAEPREGKVGGAYCISLPLLRESRVFCNFDGSISSVTTLAHELGHAYHHEVLKNASSIHRAYPMTLAETASIFSETIVFEGALADADEAERTLLIENFLQDATQVIVDILSRFLFERRLFERRRDAELSPEELCGLMLEAQKETYGAALDERFLHPYMWAVKGHYYRQDLGFYNFPYAFGQLFGLGLIARYRQEGAAFAETYRKILAETGKGTAVEVAKKAGFVIEKRDFWRSGIETVKKYVDEFEELTRK